MNRRHVIDFMRLTATSLAAELAQLRLTGPRAWLCAETVGAVICAVVMADVFHLKERWWVALSAYTIVRAHFGASIIRCVERIVGTAIGAACGFAVAAIAIHNAWTFALVLGLIAAVGLYWMIGSKRGYSWILGTVTALMVVSQAASEPSLGVFALTRVADVAVGVTSALLMVALFELISRMRRGVVAKNQASASFVQGKTEQGSLPQESPGSTIRKLRTFQAMQGAICIGALSAVDYCHPIPSFAQALVSIVAVLFVPLPALLQSDDQRVVFVRMLNRMLGCAFAALIAIALLPLIGNFSVLCAMALAGGVWIASHVQTGSSATSYIGTQFGIGFIMVFVQDQAWSTDASAAERRLAGMLIGLISLAVVMSIASAIRRYMAVSPGRVA
ncbi:hypothetical protein EKH79_00530 [Dyella dinghuensis]|uniref:Integral membrane bound transporter domain-containing protein n=1 Tax=Dyella dinghuensis TaxID=1920169 RepID=A0A3S0WS00_9GAMM|nr:FUSC family protein [Dyella dinghuensis]RUL67127.1 hypothetical protein EKH79_00530 [Dyella dinghuensis]